jgi:putative NADH-flavin reductase
VTQSVERGHQVTAFGRSAERLRSLGAKVNAVEGDLLNRQSLQGVLTGQDAVLSAFGPRLPLTKSDSDLLRRFAAVLIPAMSQAGVSRLVIVSTAFLFKDAVVPPAHLFGRLFFPTVVEDATGMEKSITESGLDWTIVRPPQLTNKPHTGKFRAREGHLPSFGFKISRADVADYMIFAVEKHSLSRKVVGVCR